MRSSAQTVLSKDNTEGETFAAILIVLLLALLNSAPVPIASVRMKDLKRQMDYKLFIVLELILRIISKGP